MNTPYDDMLADRLAGWLSLNGLKLVEARTLQVGDEFLDCDRSSNTFRHPYTVSANEPGAIRVYAYANDIDDQDDPTAFQAQELVAVQQEPQRSAPPSDKAITLLDGFGSFTVTLSKEH